MNHFNPMWIFWPLAIALFALIYRGEQKRNRGIKTVDFDYVPKQPLTENGWYLEVQSGHKPPVVSLADDAPQPHSIHIEKLDEYYYDYPFPAPGFLGDYVEFHAKWENSSIFYLKIPVIRTGTNERREVWLAGYCKTG